MSAMWSGTLERLPDESGWSRLSASSVIWSRSPRSLDRNTSNALRNDSNSSLFNTLAMEPHPVLAASRGKKRGRGMLDPFPFSVNPGAGAVGLPDRLRRDNSEEFQRTPDWRTNATP